jgi:hypothetical protein
MRRIVMGVTVIALALGALASAAGPSGAQTGSVAAFCAARLEGNEAEGKKANLATMNKAVSVAPAAVLSSITALRDQYKKKGDKPFDTQAGVDVLNQVDAWVYDNCGTKVQATATDYKYTGIPANLPSGITTIKLTNGAPKEDHMIAIVKMTPAAQGQDLTNLLSLPQKKQQKYFEDSGGSFAFASAGNVGYAPINVTPGTYAYACFLPQAGKKNGTPHFMLGMEGTFTVQ